MHYAIVQIQGKQFRVSPGDVITVDQLPETKTNKLNFSEVFLYVDGDKRQVGNPTVPYQIETTLLEQTKGPKIRVATFKAKSRYRRVKGHRQAQSKIKIEKISPLNTSSKSKSATKTTTAKSASKSA